MARQSGPTLSSDDLKRTAALSLVLTGGALAAVALASYLQKQGRGNSRVPLGGTGAASVEQWLKSAAEKLHHGSQAILNELDKSRL